MQDLKLQRYPDLEKSEHRKKNAIQMQEINLIYYNYTFSNKN